MSALRQAIMEKLARARVTVDKLHQEGGGVELTALEWEKGYAKALEEVLALEGISLRRHPRRLTSIPAGIIRVGRGPGDLGERGEGTILDLSAGGCRLATRMDLSVGDRIELSLRLPGSDSGIWASGQVLRLELRPEVPHAGVEFKDLPDAVQELLKAFCAAPA